jgi:O-methyltransferase domain
VAVVEGDLLTDPLPAGHDILIAANIVHGLSAAHNIALRNNMRNHASAGARLLLVGLWMDPSHPQPPGAPLMSGEFLVHSGEGQAYAEHEVDAWLGQTGWRKLELGHWPAPPA